MKNILAIIGVAFVVLLMLSYTPSDNRVTSYSTVLSIPVRQRGVIVTKNYEKMCNLINKGWVVEDVDISGRYHKIYYTLIKY